MRKKARIKEKEKLEKARSFELAADFPQAIKTYRSVLAGNPVHLQAATRLLVLLRKTKDLNSEVQLLKALIPAQQAHLDTAYQSWLGTHSGLAKDTAPLARILGLIGNQDRQVSNDDTLAKWQSRLQALEKRLKAKPAKATVKSRLEKKTEALKEKPKNVKTNTSTTTMATSLPKSRSKKASEALKPKSKTLKVKAGTSPLAKSLSKSRSNMQPNDLDRKPATSKGIKAGNKPNPKTKTGKENPKPLVKKR